jgi:hypothetical protein
MISWRRDPTTASQTIGISTSGRKPPVAPALEWRSSAATAR